MTFAGLGEGARARLRRTVLGRAVAPGYDTGGSFLKRTAWYFVNVGVLQNPLLPLSMPRVLALRLFGAKVGKRVLIKPNVRVKLPWKLVLEDGASLGEGAWVDNLAPIRIGRNATVSQGVYLCTGNHDWSARNEDWASGKSPVKALPIDVGDGAWIGAGVTVAPGSRVGRGTVVTIGSLVMGDLPENVVCTGRPAAPFRRRWQDEP